MFPMIFSQNVHMLLLQIYLHYLNIMTFTFSYPAIVFVNGILALIFYVLSQLSRLNADAAKKITGS